nr:MULTISPECIES: tetratricopeptide repeat protein [unclassified Leptolyngbya]
MIQNNLGAAYTDLARYREPGANLQRSVQCYQQVLEYRTPQRDPSRYAATQNNLGTAYWNLAQQERPRHYLKEAIASYGEALEYCTSEEDPVSFGMIHNNLGTAYWNLAQFEQPQHWLQRAIESYQLALKYRTPEVSLTAHAATQNNLGTAYWHLASQLEEAPQRLECWQNAIHAYDMALHAVGQLLPRTNLSFDLYASHANLGLAHYQMATDTQLRVAPEACSRHLELALNHHVSALQGWQQKPQLRQTALGHIIKTMRALYRRSGLSGQNMALSMVPADLLPEILPRL